MASDLTTVAVIDETGLDRGEAQSAVSWGAVLAGAAAALALALALVALAGGFALRIPSPWLGVSGDAAHFAPILGAWMMAIQVVSAALGGYLAGRLRSKWINVHGHEAHFRDTAHGLLTWAVSTLAGVVLATMIMAPIERHAAAMDVEAATYVAATAPPSPVVPPVDPAVLKARLARETNLTAQASFFTGVGLLLSAFTAAVAAALGGQQRDAMHARYWSERSRAS